MANQAKIIDYIIHLPLFQSVYSMIKDKRPMKLLYDLDDLNCEYYKKISDVSSDLEHQIGRLTNFKNIIKDLASLNGNLIEFGSWKGFSLLWIAYFMQRNAIFNKKLVGLDGFTGLPYADGVFLKYAMADTSVGICRKNVIGNDILYPEIKKNIIIEKFLYGEKGNIMRFFRKNNLKKFSFIHIDCDVSQSAKEIFYLLKRGDLIAD
jgi:hypothetical protein